MMMMMPPPRLLLVVLLCLLLAYTVVAKRKACVLLNADGSERSYKVIIFADALLIDVFMNWLVFYEDVCEGDLSHLDVLCMDKVTKDVLGLMGMQCAPGSFELEVFDLEDKEHKLGAIWLRRVEIIHDYISQGMDIILSDSDAIWLRDPLPDVSANSLDAQIVSSRAWFPQALFRKWGSCLCMGFIYLRAGDFNFGFTAALRRELQLQDTNTSIPDDQLAANEILDKWNITWSRSKMVVGPNSIVDRGFVVVNDTRTNVVLLPHNKFMRKCHSMKATQLLDGIGNATVVHCKLPTGNAHGKLVKLKAFSLWRLVDGWETRIGVPLLSKNSNTSSNIVAPPPPHREEKNGENFGSWEKTLPTYVDTGDRPKPSQFSKIAMISNKNAVILEANSKKKQLKHLITTMTRVRSEIAARKRNKTREFEEMLLNKTMQGVNITLAERNTLKALRYQASVSALKSKFKKDAKNKDKLQKKIKQRSKDHASDIGRAVEEEEEEEEEGVGGVEKEEEEEEGGEGRSSTSVEAKRAKDKKSSRKGKAKALLKDLAPKTNARAKAHEMNLSRKRQSGKRRREAKDKRFAGLKEATQTPAEAQREAFNKEAEKLGWMQIVEKQIEKKR